MGISYPGQTRTAAPDLDAQIISAGDDPVETSYLSFQADPALNSSLALSELHALSGTDVTVTAILRNGRARPSDRDERVPLQRHPRQWDVAGHG